MGKYVIAMYRRSVPDGADEERNRMDCAVVCEERMIWFEGMPVVVSDELMAAGIFYV